MYNELEKDVVLLDVQFANNIVRDEKDTYLIKMTDFRDKAKNDLISLKEAIKSIDQKILYGIINYNI
jgi:hypothetical protein